MLLHNLQSTALTIFRLHSLTPPDMKIISFGTDVLIKPRRHLDSEEATVHLVCDHSMNRMSATYWYIFSCNKVVTLDSFVLSYSSNYIVFTNICNTAKSTKTTNFLHYTFLNIILFY